jgi:ABC-2 type transport system ATP-binding protein
VADLTGEGSTVVLTTHHLDEAQHLADRVAVIAGGRIVAEGDPSTLGGRDRAVATIRFRLEPGVTPPVRAEKHSAGWWVLSVAEPVLVLHELTAWSIAHDITLDGLQVTRPTLEDVYLELVSEPT